MIKRTLYFGNPSYLSLRNAQLVLRLPEVSNNDTLPGKPNLKLSMQMGKLKRVSIKSLLGLNPHKVHISVLGEIKEIS